MASQEVSGVRNQISEIWQNLGRAQQVAIAAIAVACVGLIFALISWARTPEYATVFSNLSEEDAAAIVGKLKESKTPYEIANGGSAIRVPANLLYDTRLQLASSGLPQGGGVGFELFSQTNFGMTDFIQKVNYQRALEGELSRTINHLGPVEQSRVHIVMPQPSLYTDEQKEASASVVLKLKPGQRLKDAQVRGIAQLVSSSVEGLKPEKLTIVDSNGNVLSDSLGGEKDSQRMSLSQLDSQRTIETDLEQRTQTMLDRVLGYGKATVRVRAVLDWDQFESSSETYSPSDKQPQVRSARETVEKYGSFTPEVGGVPGTQSNLPGYVGVITGTTPAAGQYEKRDATTNYELSKTVEKLQRAPGAVKKLSVAVVLDGSQEAAPAQIEEVTKLVSAAVGIDSSRGDVLAVSSIPFKRDTSPEDPSALQDARQWDTYLQLGRIAAMVIGPLLLLILLFVLTRRGRSAEPYSVRRLTSEQHNGLASPVPVAALGQAGGRPATNVAGLITEENQQYFVKDQVSNLAKKKPEVMARVISNWLQEES